VDSLSLGREPEGEIAGEGKIFSREPREKATTQRREKGEIVCVPEKKGRRRETAKDNRLLRDWEDWEKKEVAERGSTIGGRSEKKE